MKYLVRFSVEMQIDCEEMNDLAIIAEGIKCFLKDENDPNIRIRPLHVEPLLRDEQ